MDVHLCATDIATLTRDLRWQSRRPRALERLERKARFHGFCCINMLQNAAREKLLLSVDPNLEDEMLAHPHRTYTLPRWGELETVEEKVMALGILRRAHSRVCWAHPDWPREEGEQV